MTLQQRATIMPGIIPRRLGSSRIYSGPDGTDGSGIPEWKHVALRSLVGVHWICISIFPQLTMAVMNAPIASLPRTAEQALRRSIPSLNEDVLEIQRLMEGISSVMRFPQRKPWTSMIEAVQSARTLTQNRQAMLDGIPEGRRDEGIALVDDLLLGFDNLEKELDEQNAENVSKRVVDILVSVADLKLLQTPGLPYLIPRAYNDQPRLTGRATVRLQVMLQSNPSTQEIVEIVLDGYSAPISCGVFASNVDKHAFDQQRLIVDADSVVLRSKGDEQLRTLPLEILPTGEFEPLYRTEIDVQTGEVPVLPLSIFGSVSLSHSIESDEQSSTNEAFIFKFDRSTAGLGGMAFDEGKFSVIGYVTKGLDTISKLQTGDTVVRAEIAKGRENLIQPTAPSPL